ncbi:flavin reductase family protein [Motiliproteus coralliicola]|uniref:Flavin reductase family protein n=1 Tax=Motiliproteus coralliicola TaxID=2283196 RepID=A0A369WUS8_9GAMM|nr:flavin reductase family protein [Motiliproteus coralliicola]RDE24883.1 flavin reductase family protein [Motiliproteus coralliicola]
MYIDLAELNPSQVYFNMIQTLVPRPIAWVMSEHANGKFNLAPFSYFSAVCSDPPLLMISVGKKPDGSHKDTRVNIEQRQRFVVHITSAEQLEVMNQSSMTLPAEISEVDELNLETVPFDGFPLPRLKGSRVAFGCELYRVDEIGNSAQSLIFGEIKQIYIDDQVATRDAKGRLKVDTAQLDPVARLGASEYMGCGEIISLKRPL